MQYSTRVCGGKGMPRYQLPRRQVLASFGAAPVVSLLSSHARAVMAPISDDTPAVRSEWMLDIALRLRLAAPVTALTGNAIILGGEARGPLLNGEVLPGVLEWSQEPARGALRLSAHYDLQDANGLRIHVADSA